MRDVNTSPLPAMGMAYSAAIHMIPGSFRYGNTMWIPSYYWTSSGIISAYLYIYIIVSVLFIRSNHVYKGLHTCAITVAGPK